MRSRTSVRARHTAVIAFGFAVLVLVGCGGAGTTARPTPMRGDSFGTVVRDFGAAPGTGTPRPGSATRAATLEPPADFAFVFARSYCGERDTTDTFAGTFTYFVPEGAYRGGTRTIPLALTQAEIRTIYEQMVAIDFFALPASASATDGNYIRPNADYEFRVRREGIVTQVRWTSGNPTPTPAEVALERLTDTIRYVLLTHPEVQAVPRGVGCT